MGSCVSKSKAIEPEVKPSLNNTDQFKVDVETKQVNKSNTQISRKNLKQKKPVVDGRIRPEEFSEAPTAIMTDRPKSATDVRLISNSLQKHFIFSNLTEGQKFLIIEHMKLYTINSNQIIFEQGTKGSAFFVICTGRVDVIVNGNKVNSLKIGESFGELALLHDTPRSATLKSIINTSFWVLDRKTFRSILEDLNAKNYQENKAFIDSIPLFKILSEPQKESLVHCLSSLKYSVGQKIVNEGDPGELLYIIKEGNVSCTQRSKEIRKMTKGDYFGEQALLYGSVRTATITALDDVLCVALSREELSSCLGASLQQIIYKNSVLMAFEKSELLNKLDKIQTENVINHMEIQSYNHNQIVIPFGTSKKSSFYVIVKGELRSIKSRESAYKVFDVVGDANVIKEIDDVYKDDFIAVGEVDIAHISDSGFFNAIGGDYGQVTNNNEAMKLLKRVQLFRGLTQAQFSNLVNIVKIIEYEDEQVIVEQNNPGDCFFLIKTGKVDIIKDGQVIRSITKNDYFGERSLLFNNFRSASVIANKKVTCWVMYKDEFLQILNEKIRKQLLERIELQDDTIQLNDLAIVKSLGNGMFGNVFLTVHKSKKSLFALKTVDRKKISAYEIEENIMLERKILLQLDHVLIMKLVRTFKDSKRLYFLMEFIRGMDLFDVIRQLDLLKECDARFYIACVFMILEHLHERSIIYRDLKPENMVVDHEGYPKLIDFGTAKFVNGRTYTIVGTPHYMAPEVITGHGYSLSADYWSVGIMLYEFLFGCVPFGEEETNPYSIYEKVQERRLVYPKWVDNKNHVKEFINQLLSKNPASRIGGNFDNLKNNPWFIGFNWDKLMSKELKAPYVPKVSNLDTEIEAAIRNNKNIDDIISRIENKDEVPKNKRHANPPDAWDSEF
ncbi:hypothetical protein SteCoe_1499 [Stentor coeruleus]|uniref:cGMP-dependent protein kinase n=1 Tax=Stentor coeruleus TaxID=5963 RepID=A0A1R2D1L4_9CILI|nr:hypothetical protein SteCoe_1499 [Stentor coeruleus]